MALFILFLCFEGAYSIFEFSPITLVTSKPAVNRNDAAVHGRSLADELEEVLSGAAGKENQVLVNVEAFAKHRVVHNASSVSEGPSVDHITKDLMVAQQLMSDANSVGLSSEEKLIVSELNTAMVSNDSLGRPRDETRDASPDRNANFPPDLNACPQHWHQRGSICHASVAYKGTCGARFDLNAATVEQKLAFERFCGVRFPRLQRLNCELDVRSPCPSLWNEIDAGICQAPSNYVGDCAALVDTNNMTDEDKYQFGLTCGASWPCLAPPSHDYLAVCPDGWLSQSGSTCVAPASYKGPCGHFLDVAGLSVADKQELEEVCDTAWPRMVVGCTRDHGLPCPLGWFYELSPRGKGYCTAPSTYNGLCNTVQSFDGMTRTEKSAWATACHALFPCEEHAECQPAWSVTCPRGWFQLDGGESCMAPLDYIGDCAPVLHGLVHLNNGDKTSLANKCAVSWPCIGERSPGVITLLGTSVETSMGVA